jgi:hypothetical protein
MKLLLSVGDRLLEPHRAFKMYLIFFVALISALLALLGLLLCYKRLGCFPRWEAVPPAADTAWSKP